MAVMIGNIPHVGEQVIFSRQPLKWFGQVLYKSFRSSRRNPSPFPDRIWSRHSALLDSAWKRSHRAKV